MTNGKYNMTKKIKLKDLLSDNVQDWFYTNCSRDSYEDVNDYIDDIRYMIADNNDELVDSCIDDLVDQYRMSCDYVLAHRKRVTKFLIKESQEALDNFSYDYDSNDPDR
jgi:hypothetical protein